MKVILVDDEQLALVGLQKALEHENAGVEIMAAYTDSTDVIAGVLKHRPDVVFLDIHMPEIDGLKLARQIHAVVPGVEIVFVTGYDQYAVRAFELYALDYIMKPIQRKRLQKTLLRLQERLSCRAEDTSKADAPMIHCFDEVRFQLPGDAAQVPSWRTSKARELFAYLLYQRDRTVSRDVLLELLWPDTDEDKAAQHLYTAVYHVRQMLKACKMDESVSIQIGKLGAGYRLHIGEAHVDADMWEAQMQQLGVLDASTADAYEQALQMYTGHYLGRYEYLWAEHERERLRLMWQHHMKMLGRYYEQSGQMEKAVHVCKQIQLLCPYEEDCYFSLMKLYAAMRYEVGVKEQYWLLKERIERESELAVSRKIEHWYEQWQSAATLQSRFTANE